MEKFSYSDLQAATNDFSLSRLIGKGSHGCVYKGILEDGKVVAVKKQSLGLQILQDNSKLDNEIAILSSLSRSPYLVNLVGVSHDPSTQKKLLVMEFIPNGSLHDSLHNSSAPPTWSKRAVMALQIARAVQALHEASPSVIHRDIKSANILFDSNWNAKLADFGLAVRGQCDSDWPILYPSKPAGTIGYLDPCYTTPGKLSTKTDVFSFGVVLLEIISCRLAIDVGREPASIVEWALPLINEDHSMEVCDSRIAVPTNMVNTTIRILKIAARCISSKEEHRPSMEEIVTELENCMVERVRFRVWRNLLWSSFLKRRPKPKTRTTTIICTTHQEDDQSGLPRGKLLIRDVLADVNLE